MTRSRAAADPDVLRFDATVTAIDEAGVELDETYFYPGGGGQPPDRGTIAGTTVVDFIEHAGSVYHVVADPASLSVGETVSCQVDPAFRRYCRRAHTASHVLFGAGRRLFEDLGYGGFDISPEKVRVDLRTPSTIDDDALVTVERLTNRAVWDDRAVTWRQVPLEEARDRAAVAFNAATEEGVMADADVVRIVEIEGWDAAACGGTHVTSTIQVGPVTVLDRSNPGEGLTRIEFTVGPPAIRRRATERRSAMRAAATLGVPLEDLGSGVVELQERLAAATEEREALRASMVETALAELDRLDRDGTEWRLGTVSEFGPNEVGDQLSEVPGDVVAVAGRDGSTFIVVASHGHPAAASVVEAVTAEFGGGGGGDATFAQGGGIDASPDAVVAYLRDR